MIYTVTLSPSLDYLVYLDTLHTGRIQRSRRESIYFSGKGINVSKVLSALGVPSVALGFVAGFTGRALEDGLSAEGVAHDFCHLPEGNTRINIKLRHDADPRSAVPCETDVNCQGPDIPESSFRELLARLAKTGKGDWVLISGSAPASLPGDAYGQMLAVLRESGAHAVVDAEGKLLSEALAYSPFLIKPNEEELAGLVGFPIESDGDVLRGARLLIDRGAEKVLVSRGEKGAILCTATGECYAIGAAKGDCVNSIGAGDSMLAGFLAGLFRTGDYEEALRLGSAAGAATAFSEGLCDSEGVAALYRTLPPVRQL